MDVFVVTGRMQCSALLDEWKNGKTVDLIISHHVGYYLLCICECLPTNRCARTHTKNVHGKCIKDCQHE